MTFRARVRRMWRKVEPEIPATIARVYRNGKYVEDIIAKPDGQRARRPVKKGRKAR